MDRNKKEMPNNPINHPTHYCQEGIECIDVMIASQGLESTQDFCICNAMKYIFRHKNKNGVEDIGKAIWYLKKFIELETRIKKNKSEEIL